METAMTIVRSGARGSTPEETFRGVFARHYGTIHAYCTRRLGRDAAADAAADVFTVAWRRVRRIPSEPETLLWLYGVARKTVANHRRSLRRRTRLDTRAAADTNPAQFEHPEGIGWVLEALREDDREILMLVAWEGLGPEALGQVLGCTANAASVRLHRARARLSAAWDECPGGAQ
jgi:RNA polymerase sigma-70 factor (ECF subfamily)